MIIKVCTSCQNNQSVIAAARALERQYGAQVTVELVECLDQCHYPPAVAVNGQLLPWADPVKLNMAVVKVFNSNG